MLGRWLAPSPPSILVGCERTTSEFLPAKERNSAGYRSGEEREQSRIEGSKERDHQREEERNQRLIDRRAEALDDIGIQALYFANAFRTWTDMAANLEVPPKDEVGQAVGFSRELAELIHQADEVSTRLALLRGHYNAHNPILEEKLRNIIEPFEKQGMERHSSLSNQLKATAASLQALLVLLQPHLVDVMDPRSHSETIFKLVGSGDVCPASYVPWCQRS